MHACFIVESFMNSKDVSAWDMQSSVVLLLWCNLTLVFFCFPILKTVWKLEYRTVTSLKQIAEGGFSRVFLVRDQNSEVRTFLCTCYV